MEKLPLKKGNLIVYVVLLALSLGAMIYGCGRSRSGSRHALRDGDTLRVAIEISPLGVATDGDTLSGLGYDMIRLIAAREGIAISIDGFTQVSDALSRLERGKCDLVIADIPATSELHRSFLLTDPIYADRQVLVQLRDSLTGLPPIRSQTQLRGDTVHLPARSPFLSRIRNLSRELGDTIFVIQDDDYGPEQMVLLTALGEIKNVVVNERVARSIAADYPQLDLSLQLSFNQFQSWAVAPGDTVLRDSLNACIARLRQTEAFSRLLDRYFGDIDSSAKR